MKEEFDYRLINSDRHAARFSIKLTSGLYSGVVYAYGNVNLTEEEVNGEMVGRLSFLYEVEEGNEEYTKEELDSNSDFQRHVGQVLESIITENEFKIGQNDPEN
jgi:hypothetical protein|tara:strand:- start:2942 stop:3253 length:312 start_codon:yes stop_codon:yes gene_type:complete